MDHPTVSHDQPFGCLCTWCATCPECGGELHPRDDTTERWLACEDCDFERQVWHETTPRLAAIHVDHESGTWTEIYVDQPSAPE
jgi:DNA-directed RNA polymerase subunit M/transcription elongation factor TFIIS